ncbi:hypothetical protein AB0I55_19575 [Actinocatenispora sera]|uniref:hypothetical protein n=1 Tax=Actinocatenispora sera TaxID=390989 RepID=UPI003403645A
MTGSTNRDVARHELERTIRAELASTRYSQRWMPTAPTAESMYEQFEAQREEIGLRNLLGAVQAVDGNVATAGARAVSQSVPPHCLP